MRLFNLSLAFASVLALAHSVSAGDLTVDFCRFRGDSGRVFLELYLDLPRSAVTHSQQKDGWFGAVKFKVLISGDGKLLAVDRWRIDDLIAPEDSIKNEQRIVDVRVYELVPGGYNFALTAEDSISTHLWQVSADIEVYPFSPDSLTLSDIEFASLIIPEGIYPKFDRGGFAMLPEPRRIFGGEVGVLYYYIEIYPSNSVNETDSLLIQRAILDGAMKTVTRLPAIHRPSSRSALSDTDSISIRALPTGSYTFEINISKSNGESAARKNRFFVFNPAITQPDSHLYDLTIDSARVMKELEEIDFLLTSSLRKGLSRMSLFERQAFLETFWSRFDDDPSTAEVPARRDYRERVNTADQRWSTFSIPGHRTDRGRVFVLFGEPDHREYYPIDVEAKPYEIWYYDRIEGGVNFVFVDRNQLGEYDLVHSTKRGEVFNPNWFDQYVRRTNPDVGR